MKLYNPRLEATVLKALCTMGTIESGKIFASITEDSFYTRESKEAYQYLREKTGSAGEMPTWDILTTTPELSDSSRDFLLNTECKEVRSTKNLTKLIDSVRDYEKRRLIFMTCDSIITKMADEDSTVAVDELTQQLEEVSSELRTDLLGVKNQIQHMGMGNNTTKLVDEVLNPKGLQVIPTGFREFDDRNGGIPIGDLVMGSANTGGGKTAIMSIQLLLNLSQSVPTCLVPLEMTKEQTMARVLSNISQVPIHRITKNDLTDSDKDLIKTRYKKFAKKLKKIDTRYSIWDPGVDVSIDEVLYSLLPFGFKVILIDYVGLLKGMDEDNQARALGAAARRAKVFAKNTGITVILLAQLGEDGKVRYSKAMSEHAALAWHWMYTEKEKESGIITIVPYKSRNQDPTPFDLAVDMSTMRATNVSDADYSSRSDPKGNKMRDKVAQTHKTAKDLTQSIEEFDLDEDEDE